MLPQNSYFETILNLIILRVGAFERRLGHEHGSLINGIFVLLTSAISTYTVERSFCPFDSAISTYTVVIPSLYLYLWKSFLIVFRSFSPIVTAREIK